jgi:amino acid transporter
MQTNNSTPQLKKELSLVMATALVIGNMIGSGILMLPSSLAQIASPGSAVLAWIITGLGSIVIALSFAKLGTIIPQTGGPYVFTKQAFGEFAGYLSAWLYWIGSWIGNAAIILGVVSCISFLFPVVGLNHVLGLIISSAILWIFTLLNIYGVKSASKVQTGFTIIKLAMFLLFIVSAIWGFHITNIGEWFPAGKGLSTLPAAATLTLWAFTGLESAAVNGGEIKNSERNIRLSTIWGIVITAILYLSISLVAMGAMSQHELATSNAPLIDAFARMLGSGAAQYIAIAALISVSGTAIGWIMITARVSYAAGTDGWFPAIFGKVHHKYQTPHASLIISAILVNILLCLNYTKGLTGAFTFVSLLATLSFLPIYIMTSAAEIILSVQHKTPIKATSFIVKSILPICGFIYGCWAIYGSGAEITLYGFLLILAGIPFYTYRVVKRRQEMDEAGTTE